MLNLAHAWLDQLLPHVLAKIDRVNYGLLSAEQTRKDMPTSRTLLAVPFLGKDVPSPAAEFAHPDVVIGFTILAYRYEGMRKSDFKHVLAEQIEQLENAVGPRRDAPRERHLQPSGCARGRPRARHRARPRRGLPPPNPEFSEIWPLHLIDVADGEQMTILQRLLRGCRS